MKIEGKTLTISKPELQLLADWASKDSSRWNLTAVWIDLESERVWSTDGPRLASLRTPAGNITAENSSETFGLAQTEARALLKIAKTKDEIILDLSDRDHATATIGAATIPLARHDGSAPAVSQIIPTGGPVAEVVGINASYLSALGALSKIQKVATVRLTVCGALDPVRIDAEFIDSGIFTLVIMPMRV